MPVRSIKKIPVYAWILPTYGLVYKIEIVGATTTDVTDLIYGGDYTDGVTETIGNFSFTIDNSNESYTTLFHLYDELNIYLDYADTATTLRFKGVIEKVSNSNNTIIVSGRSVASKIMGITVTKSYTSQYTHDILLDLFASYATYIETSGIDTTETTDTQITVNWYQRPFWECVLELCNRASYSAYIDCNSVIQYFPQETRMNGTEIILHDANLFETGDFTPDLSVVKNRIIVYGSKQEEQQIIWTAEDLDSIASYKVKEEIVNDSSITTTLQAKARADYELSLKKEPPIIGEVTSLGLPTIAPGEKVRISDPQNGLVPNYYAIQQFSHKFSNDDPVKTTLTVHKETSTLPRILKKRITFESQSSSMENANELRYSWLFDFNTDSGTHSGTEIADGFLKTDGGGSGTWISDDNEVTTDITACELRVSGDALPGTTYSISVDGGIVWQTITPNILLTPNPSGKTLKLKVGLSSATTNVDSLMLLYK